MRKQSRLQDKRLLALVAFCGVSWLSACITASDSLGVAERADAGADALAEAKVPASPVADAFVEEKAPASPVADAPADAKGPAITSLSLTEAPAADRAFFWGTIDVTAPGFVGPPRDEMTIGLGPDNSLEYVSWKELPMMPKSFGDADGYFPKSGSRTFVWPSNRYEYTATVLDSPAATPDHFLLRYRVISEAGQCDYIEATEGTRSGSGWSVVYTQEGKLFGAAISAHGQGTLFAGDPNAPAPAADQVTFWSAPVELSAPDFVGPPIDHLTVSLDGNGQIRWLRFENFVRKVSFTDSKDELGPNSVTLNSQGVVTFDDVVPATATHFVLRYHVQSETGYNDFTEGVEGTREGDLLRIRYFLSGKFWGAAMDARAAGVLVPANPPTH